jgi:hypothetical protein
MASVRRGLVHTLLLTRRDESRVRSVSIQKMVLLLWLSIDKDGCHG